VNPVQAPDVEAQQILDSAWRVSDGTLPLPVDPIVISRKLGINVFEADMKPNLSGRIVKESGEDPRIIINKADSLTRKRFTCAHELGHYLQRLASDDTFSYEDERGPLAATGMNPEEVFANQFAAALLMPATEVTERSGDGMGVGELAITFAVSAEAMSFRLRNLGLA
jgi:Zn-dependent peptidase ImmA (M78 family)